MAITIQGQSNRLGLALSGGGFQAAGFHLGVVTTLDKLGHINCVSGGSIAGRALVAARLAAFAPELIPAKP